MKKRNLLICLTVSMIIMAGCGTKSIAGTYIGRGSTLTIRTDGSWTYLYEGWTGDMEGNGTYEAIDDNTYELYSEEVTLYADIEDGEDLYVYSDDSDWIPETFQKVK